MVRTGMRRFGKSYGGDAISL